MATSRPADNCIIIWLKIGKVIKSTSKAGFAAWLNSPFYAQNGNQKTLPLVLASSLPFGIYPQSMNSLLKILGLFAIGSFVLRKAANTVVYNLVISFQSVKIKRLRLESTELEFVLALTNNNSFLMSVQGFIGQIYLGQISADLELNDSFDLVPLQTTKARFTLSIDNENFFYQLAEQQSIPRVKITGILSGGYRDKAIQIPIDQYVQVL